LKKQTKVLLTLAVIGLAGSVAGFGVFSAFSSTTTNSGNTFAAGSVSLTDNDGNASLFSNGTKAKPGDYDQCIKVTYGGTLDATVKLYTSAISSDGSKVNITVHKGTGNNANCSDFAASGGALETTSTLSAFGTAHSSFSNGLAANPGAATKWVQNDTLTYRVRLTVPDDNASQGANITSFTFTWEAQNQ
jgi:hypothetical protein